MPPTALSSLTFPFPVPSPSSSAKTTSASICFLGKPKITSNFKQPPLPFSSRPAFHNQLTLMIRSAVSIEKETPETERPPTFLRESEGGDVRARFEKMIREVQDSVCQAIEAVDNRGKFKEDVWSRPGGGGGISRVLQDGAVWEKAGVNVSVVYGVMPPEAYRAAKAASADQKPGPIPFFAAGISSVLHPKNPFAPTLHFNYRYFETDASKDAPGAPRQWWFGGGTDLTPAYIFEEDVKHFHSVNSQIRSVLFVHV